MITIYLMMGTVALMGLAEWLHARRTRHVARLAFGPDAEPLPWTTAVPWLRMLCAGALAWGFLTLIQIGPRMVQTEELVPEGGYRHLLLALDVSPSMQLEDAGPEGKRTRAQRASEVMSSLLDRIATDQVRISIVAFYTGAKAVVVDTYDLDVVQNCLNELPLEVAFDVGKTELLEGVRESATLAKPWSADSTTLILVSDGDTIPDSGMPELPRSIRHTLVVGVGDARVGRFIDGHQSRQDVFTMRQLATRLRGDYFDANQKHLPSNLLSGLSQVLPLRDARERGLREAALVCIGAGSFTLAGIPVALALVGSRWQAGTRSSTKSSRSDPASFASKTRKETVTYA